MDRFFEFFKNEENLRKWITSRLFAFLAPLIALSVAEPIWKEIKNRFSISDNYFSVVYVCCCLLLYYFWWALKQPPKIKYGKIGIVISILTENDDEKKRLKNDFVRQFMEGFTKDDIQNYEFIVLNDYFAKKIDSFESAKTFQGLMGFHFLIWGTWKTRLDNGKETYILDLRARVAHAPVDERTGKRFSVEMSEVFPQKIKILKEIETDGIEITSDLIIYAVQYCLGIAALLTGDYRLSFDLHQRLWDELNSIKDVRKIYFQCVNTMKARLPLFIHDEGQIMLRVIHKAKPEGWLNLIKKYADIVLRINPRSYTALNSLAIYHFKQKEVLEAFQIVKRSMKVIGDNDSSARMSLAFLYAYQGDLEEAHKNYKRAFDGHVRDPISIPEIEEFIDEVLLEEPGKYQLFYCLGMINFYVKEDYQLALEYFSKFLEYSEKDLKFQKSREFAEDYVRRIKEKIKSNN